MQLLSWIHVLLAAGFLWLSGKAQLTVFLEEARPGGNSSTIGLIVEGTRSFSLVPGLTYRIHCRSAAGFGGLSDIWQDSEGNTIVLMDPVPVLNFTETAVYSIQQSSDTNERSLVLQSFSESSTGTYVCHTDEDGGTDAVLMIGAGNPTIITSVPVLELSEGFNIARPSLLALASSDPMPESTTWLFAGQELQSGTNGILVSSMNNLGELLFPFDIDSSFAGNYEFTVESAAGDLSATVPVMVIIQPSVTIEPNADQSVDSGTSFTITCTDSQGVPFPTFTWDHDGDTLQTGGRITIVTNERTSSLTIDPVQREDTGNYRCVAMNSAGGSPRDVEVQVRFPPVLESVDPDEAIAAVGEDTVTLQGRLVDAFPAVTGYTWKRLTPSGNETLSPSDKYSFSADMMNITISNVESADHGVYYLEATNGRGTGSTSFVVVVIEPINAITYGASGGSIALQVAILAPQSLTTTFSVSGRFNSNPLSLGSKYSGSVEGMTAMFTIASLELADSGTYTVIVSGEDDSGRVDSILRVLFPPVPPTNVTGTNITDCIAMVSWRAAVTPNDNTAAANFTVIEMQMQVGDSSSVWRVVADDIAVGTLETTVNLLAVVPNTLYRFRARSRSVLIGATGDPSEPSNDVIGYPESSFLSVESLVGMAAGYDRVSLEWQLPQLGECLSFTGFDIKCYPRDVSGTPREVSAGRGVTTMEVDGLAPDTLYECDVTSNFANPAMDAFVAGQQVSERIVTFTYPMPPVFSPDSVPVADSVNKPATNTTITVQFTRPEPRNQIGYYQVIVLRLESKDLPTGGDPDDLYDADFPFADTDVKGDVIVPYIAAEVDEELFNPLFTIGGGPVSGSSFANEKLTPMTYYTAFLRTYVGSRLATSQRKRRQGDDRQRIVFSSSDFLPTVLTDFAVDRGGSSKDDRTRTIGIIVGATVAGVLVISVIIICIGILCLRNMSRGSLKIEEVSITPHSDDLSQEGTPEIPEVDTPDLAKRQSGFMELKPLNEKHSSNLIPSGPIPVKKFDSHIEVFDADRQLLFQAEFDWIQAHAPWHPAENSNHPLNDDKNRYSNITAYDHTRVRLTPIEGIQASDYINANYISGYPQEKAYIATQGPLDQTVTDFWRMIWEQNTATIVMLTGLVELGKNKCYQYWPNNSTTVYGSLQVTLEHSVVLPDYTIRNLDVKSLMTGELRTVLQFHFSQWPDYGTPKLAAPLLNFLRAVHSSNPDQSGPIVIHCSAGVGRSGTVICIDYCLNQAKAENIVHIRGCVSKMREQRNWMVQTEQQYTFIHYAVMESIAYGNTSFPLAEFPSSYQQLQEKTGQTGNSLLEEEFSRLGTVRTMVKKSSFVQKVKQKQANGRRSIHYPSGAQYENSGLNPEYNAHYIDSYLQPKLFIAADIPTPESAARFWQMVWDQGCSYIVMLTPLDAQFYCYWPSAHEQEQHGNVIVEVTEESAEHLYTTRTITLTNAKDGISHRVQQYQFIGWTTNYLPPVPTFVSFVCEVLKGVETLQKNQRLLVHDIESLGPSGIFCSLCYCIERLRVERIVDVFQAVQKIQLQRPNMVESMQQYAFIYDCVYEFIRTHSNS